MIVRIIVPALRGLFGFEPEDHHPSGSRRLAFERVRIVVVGDELAIVLLENRKETLLLLPVALRILDVKVDDEMDGYFGHDVDS